MCLVYCLVFSQRFLHLLLILVPTVLHLSVLRHERARNKLWYFQLATSETISASCRNLKECLTIEVNYFQVIMFNI